MRCRRGWGNRKRGQVRGWTAAPVEEGGGVERKGDDDDDDDDDEA